jgi:hypothetical protein
VPVTGVTGIINGKRGITADTALPVPVPAFVFFSDDAP